MIKFIPPKVIKASQKHHLQYTVYYIFSLSPHQKKGEKYAESPDAWKLLDTSPKHNIPKPQKEPLKLLY